MLHDIPHTSRVQDYILLSMKILLEMNFLRFKKTSHIKTSYAKKIMKLSLCQVLPKMFVHILIKIWQARH